MPAGLYDLLIEAGVDWTLSLAISDTRGLLDLAGYEGALTARVGSPTGEAMFTASSANERLWLDMVARRVLVRLDAATTRALPRPERAESTLFRARPCVLAGVYDLVLFTPAAAPFRLLQGRVFISPEIAR